MFQKAMPTRSLLGSQSVDHISLGSPASFSDVVLYTTFNLLSSKVGLPLLSLRATRYGYSGKHTYSMSAACVCVCVSCMSLVELKADTHLFQFKFMENEKKCQIKSMKTETRFHELQVC